MRVLHVFSNWKWTGPAEPVLNLCIAQRGAGIEADFACGTHPRGVDSDLFTVARSRGIEPLANRHLQKHRNLWHTWHARRFLNESMTAKTYDIVHCHLDHGHWIAAPVARKRGVPVVRSVYDGEGMSPSRYHRRLLGAAEALILPSEMARENHAHRFPHIVDQTYVIAGAVDTHRFDPNRNLDKAVPELAAPEERFVFGIVARLQRHRRFEDLFWAFKKLIDEGADAHLVVVGRGTHQKTVGHDPVRELGLSEHVTFAGYVSGEAFVAVLRRFDAGIYLMPGSDGTCRTIREIMAAGVPPIAADRGMVREIVTHEHDGLVFDGSREGLYDAMKKMCSNSLDARRLGSAAREKARAEYSLERQAARVQEVYEAISGHV